MISTPEQVLSRSLRRALADSPNGAAIPDSEDFRNALTALEYFIPVVLGEIHPEWKFEGLDAVQPVDARKIGPDETEIIGVCCLVSDQTLAPVHLRIQHAAETDEISWFECSLGEQGRDGMLRVPYHSRGSIIKRIDSSLGRSERIDWCYHVTFGDRRT